jgi:hypothetical protein
MTFRKTKSPYSLCQQILEGSNVDLVMFEAADVLKNAIVVEWNYLQEADRLGLRQYLLNFITQREMPPFIRAKLFQVVAIMLKRASLVDMGQERGQILAEAKKMLLSGDSNNQILSCSLILAMMNEYVNTVKSDDIGLTFEDHFKAKKQFENSDMRTVFILTLQTLEELMKTFVVTNAIQLQLLRLLLEIMEIILVWGYVSPIIPKKLINLCETVQKFGAAPPFRCNLQWAPIILDPKGKI